MSPLRRERQQKRWINQSVTMKIARRFYCQKPTADNMIEQGNVFPARCREDGFRRMANICICLLHTADTAGRLKNRKDTRRGGICIREADDFCSPKNSLAHD